MIDNSIYRHIVKNSKSAYFYGEIVKDQLENIIDFKVIDINDALEKKLNAEKDYIIGNLSNILWKEIDWIEILNEVMEYEKYSDNHYFNIFREWYEIELQKIDETHFYILMNEAYKIDNYTQTLLDVFPAGIWYKDKDGRYITSSKAMLYNERVKDRDIKGKTDIDIQYSKEVAKEIMDHDFELMEFRKSDEYNTVFDNNTTGSTQKHCVCDKDGNLLGTVGFYIDITDHENLKSDYHNHKKLSDLLLQTIPDQLVYKDTNGVYKYCNKSFVEYLGLNDERDVIGRCDNDFFEYDKKKQDFFQKIDTEIIKSKFPLRYEISPVKNGDVKCFDVIKTPFINDEGEVIGITAVIRDITEQQINKNKIRENEQQLNSIINAISDAIILSDKDNVIYVNKAFEDIFGINKEEYIKNPMLLYNLFTKEYKEKLGDYKFEENYNIEIKIKTKDGKEKWIWYKGYLLDENHKDGRKITIIRDVTAKKEYDMELDRLRMEFFSNISHELRTPLNLIFSSLQLIDLKLHKNGNNIDYYDRYLNIIRQNSLRLLKLVNNLIDSTRIDSGYISSKYENGDIIYFVEQIFNSIEEYAKSKNIQLIFDTDVEEKVTAFDMDKVERIILNLLSNAIKFNKENGKIFVTMKAKSNMTEVMIKDTGIGIPKCKIETIFDRFTQVNNRMTKISEGSGIGLSLTKSLIEMQGGSIEINSTLDEGTEFKLTIPDKMIDDYDVNHQINGEYNSFVKKLEIEFSDIY